MFAAIDPSIFVALVAAVLGGGGFGALLAYRKTGAEAESVAARTLITVNDELRKELARRDLLHSQELARRDQEIASLRERVAVLENHAGPSNGGEKLKP